MSLTGLTQFAGLSFAISVSTTLQAQAAQTRSAGIQPYVTVAIGPSILESRHYTNGGDHPIVDATIGAGKRLTDRTGVVFSVNAGTSLKEVISGENAVCRIRIDGKAGCYPNTPLVSWFGMSAGGERHFGGTVLGLQFGPSAFRVPKYERDLVAANSPTLRIGLRSQFDANFQLYRRMGTTLSAVNRFIPSILNDRWHVNSVSAGVTLR